MMRMMIMVTTSHILCFSMNLKFLYLDQCKYLLINGIIACLSTCLFCAYFSYVCASLSVYFSMCVVCLFVVVAIDTNECLERSHDCSKYALCHNKLGAYDCICMRGYDGDGKVCKGKPSGAFVLHDVHVPRMKAFDRAMASRPAKWKPLSLQTRYSARPEL